jgi:hypothetical protein
MEPITPSRAFSHSSSNFAPSKEYIISSQLTAPLRKGSERTLNITKLEMHRSIVAPAFLSKNEKGAVSGIAKS